MARRPFGGTTADFVESVRSDGTLQADQGATCTFYTAATGGLAITDLQDMAGNPITSVSADGSGALPPFMGPNDGTAKMWVSAGGAARQLMQATDTTDRVGTIEAGGAASEPLLKIVGPKTASYTANVGELATFDLTSGSLVLTLPNAPANNSVAGGKIVVQPGANTLTIACQGTDRIDVGGGATSSVVRLLGQAKTYKYQSGLWVTIDDDLPLTQLDLRFLALAPVQRGVWAPTTLYNAGELAISPTGDIITPKVTFTSGASYSVANWNILVPAQNYGRELAGAESMSDLNLLGTAGTWTDVPGMTATIPSGIPFTCEITALCASLQGTMAAGSITGVQVRVVDAATATTVYGFAWRQFLFPVAGQSLTQWNSLSGFRRQAALGSSTAVKMQAIGSVATGAGNIGLFPASGGAVEPTTFIVRGR